MKNKLALSLILTVFFFVILIINPSSAKAISCPDSLGSCCNVDIQEGRNYCQGSTPNNGCEHINGSDSITNAQGCLSQWNYVTQSYACDPGEPGNGVTCDATVF